MKTVPKFKYRDIIRLKDDEFDFKYIVEVSEDNLMYLIRNKQGVLYSAPVSIIDDTHTKTVSKGVF